MNTIKGIKLDLARDTDLSDVEIVITNYQTCQGCIFQYKDGERAPDNIFSDLCGILKCTPDSREDGLSVIFVRSSKGEE